MSNLKTLLETIVNEQGGFLFTSQIAELAELDRLRNVLVRCGNGRFSCPVQDALWFIEIITAQGQDYIRDVSLPSSDGAFRGDFSQATKDPPARPVTAPGARCGPDRPFREECCGGAFDGVSVTSDADPGL